MDVVVVIGAGGMGQAIARRQGIGTRLLVADFDKDQLAVAADELRGEGYEVTAEPVDVSSHASVTSLAERAAGLGPVRTVAHTAGVSPVQASVPAILAVDLLGTALVLEEFGQVIAAGGAGVVISSMAGHFQPPFSDEDAKLLALTPADELLALPIADPAVFPAPGLAYAFAKRANQVRVQAASVAWGDRGARVNSISPGVIATPMGRAELAGDSGAMMQMMIDASNAKRAGAPADVAAAAAFLLGPESTFISGADLLVDGGGVAAVRTGRLG